MGLFNFVDLRGDVLIVVVNSHSGRDETMGDKIIKVRCSMAKHTLWFHLPFKIDSGRVHPMFYADVDTQLVETHRTGINPMAELENDRGVRLIGLILQVLGAKEVKTGPEQFMLTLNDPGDWEQAFQQVVRIIRKEPGYGKAKFEVHVTDGSIPTWHASLVERFG